MLEGKIIVVTGASSGIGLGIARRFVQEGATVVGVGSTEETIGAAKAKNPDDRFVARACDVSDGNQIIQLKDFVEDSYGRLDALINNAGRGKFKISPEHMCEDDFYYHYETNIKGPMLLVKHFAPLLRKTEDPCIVNMSSTAALVEFPEHMMYSTTKAALEKFTRHLVRDLPGIRINSIAPGWIDTPLIDKAGFTGEEKEALFNMLKTKIPAGRIGEPDDIAQLVLFLCSKNASYINGAAITIDGGWTCSPDWGA
jgi:NAD(P)-dependent dehydrogenase (short-subunit alcohol dehydrogenase family)